MKAELQPREVSGGKMPAVGDGRGGAGRCSRTPSCWGIFGDL